MVGMTSKSAEQTAVGPECLGFHFTDISSHISKTTKRPPSNYRPLKMLHYYIAPISKCIWQCFLYQLLVLKPEERNLLRLFGVAMILKIGSICPSLLISCFLSYELPYYSIILQFQKVETVREILLWVL